MSDTKEIRFSLCLEPQFIHHGGDEPVVDFFGVVLELDEFASSEQAITAAANYLSHLGAKLTWAGVEPIEKCACCDGDIHTAHPHMVLSITAETGPYEDIEVLDGEYAARFCNDCVPPQAETIAESELDRSGLTHGGTP